MYHRESLNFHVLGDNQFEELIFEILKEEGFNNLTWFDGSGDGGKDIKAEFSLKNAAGGIESQKWYCDAKLYKAGVPWPKIQPTMSNSLVSRPDYVLLAIHPHLTPDCKSSLEEFKKNVGCPKVEVWEGKHIEELTYKHPGVLRRYFPDIWSKALHKYVSLQEIVASIKKLIEDSGPIWKTVERRSFSDSINYDPQPDVPSVEVTDLATILNEDERASLRAVVELRDKVHLLLCTMFGLPITMHFLPGTWDAHPDVKILGYAPIQEIVTQEILAGIGRLLGSIDDVDSLNHLRSAGIIAGASSWRKDDEIRRIHAYFIDISTQSKSVVK